MTKTIMLKILIVLSLSVCFISATLFVTSSNLFHDNRELTEAELQQIRYRLPCLKTGMTRKDVNDTLGINLDERASDISGSGPRDDYRNLYQLNSVRKGEGYNLLVVYDEKSLFKRAVIACWVRNSVKCAEDNKKAEGKGCPKDSSTTR